MARIFISYSRVDRTFVEALAAKLRRIYGHDNVWFDEGLHGGDIWWEEILNEIAARDIFIYVLSNDSVQSDYCQAEFAEARRLRKQIITVQARDRTRLTDELGDIHYINMANGVDDADALTDLYRSINKRATKVPKRRLKPLWEPPTPRPGKVDEKPRTEDTPDVDTPTLEVPQAERQKTPAVLPWWKKPEYFVPLLAAVIMGILGLWQGVFANTDGDNTLDPIPTTAVAQNPPATDIGETTLELSETETVSTLDQFPTVTLSATPAPTATYTPTIMATPIIASVSANYTQIKVRSEPTVTGQQIANLNVGSNVVIIGKVEDKHVAGWWYQIQIAEGGQFIQGLEPIGVLDPTSTSTAYIASHLAALPSDVSLDEIPEIDLPGQVGVVPVTRNADWTPVERNFDGVTMVLVSAGCFDMGSDNGDDDEQPVHEICFDEPFWIDKYEVTNEQFVSFLNHLGYDTLPDDKPFLSYPSEQPIERAGLGTWMVKAELADHPVTNVTWDGASSYCNHIGGYLPTGYQWRMAASWDPTTNELRTYPWGGELPSSNLANYDRNFELGTVAVYTLAEGQSAVGAFNMVGNVSEWVSDADTALRSQWGGGWTSSATELIIEESEVTSERTYTTRATGFRCGISLSDFHSQEFTDE